MNKVFIFLTFACIALWIAGLLFMDIGFEIHLLLVLAAMCFALKLIKDELTRGNGTYL